MKMISRTVTLAFVFLIGQSAFASQSVDAQLRYFRLSDCHSWINLSGPSYGYGCAYYPGAAEVPEIHSLVAVLNQQAAVIDALEQRVKALELK